MRLIYDPLSQWCVLEEIVQARVTNGQNDDELASSQHLNRKNNVALQTVADKIRFFVELYTFRNF